MSKKRHTAGQIIGLLRQAEAGLAQGRTMGDTCGGLGVSEESFFRWRTEYGGLKLDRARRLKELERENARLKRAVAQVTLDKLILKEAAEGNFQAPGAAVLACGMCRRCPGCPSAEAAGRGASRVRRSARFGRCGPTRLH